jgi:hypothetical protein
MVWIKRNLFLVLFIAGTLAMTGLAVFFLINRKAAEEKIATELKKASDELGILVKENPFPSDANINGMKKSAAELADLTTKVKPLFTVPVEQESDSITFKSLLENTIAELDAEAKELGIDIPAKSSFTFTVQRSLVNFPTNSIGPLTRQLREIKEICHVVFQAKVHSLSALRRVRAYPSEAVGGGDYIAGKTTVTNAANVVKTPYEVEFKGFSSELTSVLEGLQKSSIFVVVKTVKVVPMGKSGGLGNMGGRGMGRRLNQGSVPAGNSQPAARQPAGGGQPAAGARLVTVFDEKPKKFSLKLEVVKTFAK